MIEHFLHIPWADRLVPLSATSFADHSTLGPYPDHIHCWSGSCWSHQLSSIVCYYNLVTWLVSEVTCCSSDAVDKWCLLQAMKITQVEVKFSGWHQAVHRNSVTPIWQHYIIVPPLPEVCGFPENLPHWRRSSSGVPQGYSMLSCLFFICSAFRHLPIDSCLTFMLPSFASALACRTIARQWLILSFRIHWWMPINLLLKSQEFFTPASDFPHQLLSDWVNGTFIC